MTIPIDKWKDVSFWSGFGYMRLVDSGSVTVTDTGGYAIPIDTGSGTPFIEVYCKQASSSPYGAGAILPLTGVFMTGGAFWSYGGTLYVMLEIESGSFTDYYDTIYYFVYESNAVVS